MRRLICAAILLASASGCAVDETQTLDAGDGRSDAGTSGRDAEVIVDPPMGQLTPLSFCVDDTMNQTYTAQHSLVWKGSFSYDAATRLVEFDAAWSGPYIPLYDDGPWTRGGHEPEGTEAGDHIWCVTAFLRTPSEDVDFEYGVENEFGWIWPGRNGAFTVLADRAEEVIVDPLVIPAFGRVDLRVTVDIHGLAPGWTGDPDDFVAEIQGLMGFWHRLPMLDSGAEDEIPGDGVYTFVLSQHVGPDAELPHSGLLREAEPSPFLLVLDGREYRGEVPGHGLGALATGVRAEISVDGAPWRETPIGVDDDGNLFVQP